MELSNDIPHRAAPDHSHAGSSIRHRESSPRNVDGFAEFLRELLGCPPDGKISAVPERYADFKTDSTRCSGAMVFSIGEDAHLLGTRQLILESVGYRVHSVFSHSFSAEDFAAPVDIAIICHTVEERRVLEIVLSLRNAHPLLPILHLGASTRMVDVVDSKYDYAVEVIHGPRLLLQTLACTLRPAG